MTFFKYKIVFSFYFVSCLLSLTSLRSQSLLFPRDYLFDVQRQRAIMRDTIEIIHSSMQPFIYKEILPDTFKKLKPGADPFSDKIFYENLIEVRHIDKSSGYDRKFNININPIVNFTMAKDVLDTANNKISTNTRGFWLRGELGKKLIFESAFIENQSYFPSYLKDFATSTQVVPGQGRWKQFKANGGFDYATASGILHFQASRNFFIRLGHGKQKVGNGYRSLLLSDNSLNYPYLQLIASFFKQKLQYSQTYALLMNISTGGSKTPPGTEQIFQKKAASFQQLSWHTSKYLDIYFFQGMIWKATDSTNTMHLSPFYTNPVIFSNLARYGFNDANHILIGGGFEARLTKKIAVYTQFMYDGSYGGQDNSGLQAGFKLFDLFGVKNLYIQAEYNRLNGTPYVSAIAAQSYSHYNQILTTPALFPNEIIEMLSYTYKRVFIQLKNNYSVGDAKEYTSYFDAKIGYMVNPRYNFNISAGTTIRTYNVGINGPQQMQLFYVSLRTSLYNLYYDF